MQADINYHVKFSDKIDASEKAKILREVSGALTTDGPSDTTDSIIGLFVRMKLDGAWCIVPNNGESEKSVESLVMAQASVVIKRAGAAEAVCPGSGRRAGAPSYRVARARPGS
jgi:hypothetical protein